MVVKVNLPVGLVLGGFIKLEYDTLTLLEAANALCNVMVIELVVAVQFMATDCCIQVPPDTIPISVGTAIIILEPVFSGLASLIIKI